MLHTIRALFCFPVAYSSWLLHNHINLENKIKCMILTHKNWYYNCTEPKYTKTVMKYTVQGTTVYPKKYAHGFCFAVLCCGNTLTDFPISIRLTSLALWQSNDCPSASKATLMNMDKYFMWIHYERLHNHKKAKHNKTVCIFLGIYCIWQTNRGLSAFLHWSPTYVVTFAAWQTQKKQQWMST